MKKIWAIADLHLACGVPGKNMNVFGPLWDHYMDKIKAAWISLISSEDLVLIAGDISWAMYLDEVIPDLAWIEALPGTKVILKGNHDFWWSSAAKMAKIMPHSVHFIHNSVYNWHGASIGGTRLWDSDEYSFCEYIHFQDNPKKNQTAPTGQADDGKIFNRELERLKLSLKQLSPSASLKIAMVHYPPISADLRPSRTSTILEEFHIDICVFGHLHNIKKDHKLFGEIRGVKYCLTACDYLNFKPILLASL
jgi:predicted phosphohydrolase